MKTKIRCKGVFKRGFICLCLIFLLTPSALAYVLTDMGHWNKRVEIEDRTSYSEFHTSRADWNSAVSHTGVYFQEVPGSGHSWITDNQVSNTWYGYYYVIDRYLLVGRVTKFHIELNRNILVNESSNCKRSVITHELGHALGLGDNPPETRSIMRYDRNRDTMFRPYPDDVRGVEAYFR